MEDLSSLSQALVEALQSEAAEDRLAPILEQYFQSDDRFARVAATDALAVLLSDESRDAEALRTLVLQETALTLIPTLLPILAEAPSSVETIFKHISDVSRPREVVLALNEALQHVEERVEGVQTSDDEDQGGFAREGVDYEELGRELLLLLLTYTRVVPRINTTRSTPTLLTLSEASEYAIAGLAPRLSVQSARQVMEQICYLVDACWTWAQATYDNGGEQRSILFNMLVGSLARYAPGIDAHLFEQWFIQQNPRYTTRNEAVDTTGKEVLGIVSNVVRSLRYSAEDLYDLIRSPGRSPFGALSAVTILAHDEAVDSSPAPQVPLAEQMSALSAALSGSAIDAGLLKVFLFLVKGGQPNHDQATLLLELVMPLAAFPTAPTTQLALLKLLEAIVESQATEEKALVLKQLLEPQNPFEHVRLRSLAILRSQLASHSDLLPHVLPSLSPVLFSLPSTDPPIADMSLSDLRQTMHPAWLTECVNLLWFMIDLDKDNQSGVRIATELGTIDRQWLGPVELKIREIKASDKVDEGDTDGAFILDMWEVAVSRARQSVDQILYDKS